MNDEDILNEVLDEIASQNPNKQRQQALKVLRDVEATGSKIIYNQQGEQFLIYKDGFYQHITLRDIEDIVEKNLRCNISRNMFSQIIAYMQTLARVNNTDINRNDLINLKNGVYSLEYHDLGNHNPAVIDTIQLNVSHDPDNPAPCPMWTKTLDEIFLGDKNKIRTIQEYFGYCLTKNTIYQKALCMVGEGANGKSLILYVLEELLSRDHISSLSMDMLDNYAMLAQLEGKLANISGEIKAKGGVCDHNFKQIVAGDTITVSPKYIKPYNIKPFAKMIFATNELPHVQDKSHGFYRRLLIVEFTRIFQEDDESTDPLLKYKIAKNELDGVFAWAVEGLKALNKRGRFLIDEYMKKTISEYKKENNSVIGFAEECINTTGADDGLCSVSVKELYAEYKKWSEAMGLKYPLSMIRFSKEIKRLFPYARSDGRDSSGDHKMWQGIELRKDWS